MTIFAAFLQLLDGHSSLFEDFLAGVIPPHGDRNILHDSEGARGSPLNVLHDSDEIFFEVVSSAEYRLNRVLSDHFRDRVTTVSAIIAEVRHRRALHKELENAIVLIGICVANP